MSAFLLGSNTSLWVPLAVLAPLNDAHSETIATTTQSLGGVSTQNIRAVKRRWTLPLRITDNSTMARLTVLREVYLGPFWLFDGSRPNLLSSDRRMMTGWNNGGAVLTPTTDLRLLLPANATVSPELLTGPSLAGLVPVLPGQTFTFGVTVKAAAASTLTLGFRWYTAAGTFISATTSSPSVGTTESRLSGSGVAPANTAYVQPSLLTASSTMTVTDPTVVPGPVDIGAAWHVVLVDDMTESHHNLLQMSPTLMLREV